jgi:hypothetical protein
VFEERLVHQRIAFSVAVHGPLVNPRLSFAISVRRRRIGVRDAGTGLAELIERPMALRLIRILARG